MTTDATTAAAPPVIRVLHGHPTPEEIGVVVALMSAMGGGEDASGAPSRQSRWAAPATRLGSAGPGRDSWRFSGMPR